MVKALHEAGLEVILDVVYNHTGEGGRDGPTLSLRGLDNQAYYRLQAHDRSQYLDYTGTGNSLNMLEPHVLQLIMDSLRFWIDEMHVDGFRFDWPPPWPGSCTLSIDSRPSSTSSSRTRSSGP